MSEKTSREVKSALFNLLWEMYSISLKDCEMDEIIQAIHTKRFDELEAQVKVMRDALLKLLRMVSHPTAIKLIKEAIATTDKE